MKTKEKLGKLLVSGGEIEKGLIELKYTKQNRLKLS